MQLLHYDNQHEISTARWLARGLSILIGGTVVMLYLFNEDVLNDPTPSTILLGAITLSMLIAWRWERVGGLLTMIGSLLIPVTMIFHWSGTVGLITPIPLLVLTASGITLSFLIIGWLFVSVAPNKTGFQEHESEDEIALPHKRRSGIYLIIGFLGLAAILLFLVPMFIPMQQRIEAPSFDNVAYDQIISELRAQGAVVGVGSIPAENALFSVSGLELDVDGKILQAFEYVDVAAATADASAIYYGENPAWESTDWPDTPHLFQVNNILLFYAGNDKDIMNMLERAFGPPIGVESRN